MRKPSTSTSWLTRDELKTWVKESPDKQTYQRRLAIWLAHSAHLPAHHIAALLLVSVQAVWKWLGEYKTLGPAGLDRKGRGGLRWTLMTLEEERTFLLQHLDRLEPGEMVTAKRVRIALSEHLGREVSLNYAYKLLHRHPWAKVGRSCATSSSACSMPTPNH